MAASPPRSWRAACPNCGAAVDFASAASASAICGFCRSTLLRDGESLKRIGVSAELFDDHSPLQLGAAGKHQGVAFTLVGRQQLGDDSARWNEWHLLFDASDGSGFRSGWLSEDNGAHVIAFDAALQGVAPPATDWHAGEKRLVSGSVWDVASVVQARVLAAEGELPQPPRLDGPPFTIVDLRNANDEVGTLDWRDPARVGWSVGRSVRLDELALTGLREASEKTLSGRGIECQSCGASLPVSLSTTQSIVCGQCKAVVDLSQGVGGELAHYAQDNVGAEPQIALGSRAKIQFGARSKAVDWQVVGYVERQEVDLADGDDASAWREYLLYNANEGFVFLVDADDGWSYARPITGVPQVRGEQASYQGTTYKQLYSYTGAVTYVLGEFYWRLERGERTVNTDYAAGRMRLNREQTASERTWSAGQTMEAKDVAMLFGLQGDQAKGLARDALPTSRGAGRGVLFWAITVMLVLIVLLLVAKCSGDDCSALRETYGEQSNEYQQCVRSGGGSGAARTGGGSYGGFSSGGGGHK
ncbi:MAG: DUF4178 domain-containing protein [Burkholderiales bacterium]|nr:DUF4178 domain-containing protein [Burkholderiales bacterium]